MNNSTEPSTFNESILDDSMIQTILNAKDEMMPETVLENLKDQTTDGTKWLVIESAKYKSLEAEIDEKNGEIKLLKRTINMQEEHIEMKDKVVEMMDAQIQLLDRDQVRERGSFKMLVSSFDQTENYKLQVEELKNDIIEKDKNIVIKDEQIQEQNQQIDGLQEELNNLDQKIKQLQLQTAIHCPMILLNQLRTVTDGFEVAERSQQMSGNSWFSTDTCHKCVIEAFGNDSNKTFQDVCKEVSDKVCATA